MVPKLRAAMILKVALFSLVLSGCARLGFDGSATSDGAAPNTDGAIARDIHEDTASDQRPDHPRPGDGPVSDLTTPGDQKRPGDSPIPDPDLKAVVDGPVPVPDQKAVVDGPVLDSTTGKICSWAKPLQATGDLLPYYVGVDSAGNIYIAGEFKGTSSLGPTPTPAVSGSDLFLVSYSSTGAYRWSKHFGTTSYDEMEGMGVDPAGGVAIAVRFFGPVDFGGGMVGASGKWNAGVARFNAKGVHVWSQSLSATSLAGIVIDAAGVTVSGGFWNSIGLGGTTLTSNGYSDIFLVRYDPAGTHLWSKSFGLAGNDVPAAISRDPAGNLSLVGTFDNTTNLGGKNISSNGYSDIFLASYTSSGGHRWSLGFGSGGSDSASSVTTDKSGNVLIACGGVGGIDFGGGALPYAGSSEGFVASFNTSGAYRWAKAIGGTLQDSAASVTTDTLGNAYVVGHFTNSANLGGGIVSSAGGLDGYISSFTSTGAHRFSLSFGSSAAERAHGVAYSSGAVVVTGSYTQQIDLGCGPLPGSTWVDGFVARLAHP